MADLSSEKLSLQQVNVLLYSCSCLSAISDANLKIIITNMGHGN